jgi:pilus assembly protein CpaB
VNRRLALLLTAVVIAAAGTALVFLYVKNADDRALADQKPVKVWVATNTIPAGTSIRQAQSQGDLDQKTVTESSTVDNALSSLARYQDLVTQTTIISGQQLSLNMLGDQPLASAALPVEEGDIAASFDFTNSGRVAGFVEPGSRVVVFGTLQGSGGEQVTGVLLGDAKVLAVGPVSGLEGSESANSEKDLPRTVLTLSVSDVDAARLILASENGSLYLGLRDDKSDVSTDTEVSQENLLR